MTRRSATGALASLLTLLVVAAAGSPLARASVPDAMPVTCSEGAFTAEYFDDVELTGRAFLVECHERIDFDWGHGRPHPRVPEDHFAVRWSADLLLSEGTYRFAARTDDGTRVYLDGELIIDSWHPRSVRTTEAYGHVPAGPHSLVVEYFEQAGHAGAELAWERASSGWFQVPAQERRTVGPARG